MIDTDKYERLHNLAQYKVLPQVCANDILDLLAEVKRLREGIKAYLDLEIETHELKEMIE
tara:strand:+ start:226 stop:405 length:180 start_codon:yes stop_codon:yes gene_type:complete